MPDIFDEIFNKIHEFGIKHNGKRPNWIYLNREHLYLVRSSPKCHHFVTISPPERETICGMQYVIKDELTEIEVQ